MKSVAWKVVECVIDEGNQHGLEFFGRVTAGSRGYTIHIKEDDRFTFAWLSNRQATMLPPNMLADRLFGDWIRHLVAKRARALGREVTLSMGFHSRSSLDEKAPLKDTLQNLT